MFVRRPEQLALTFSMPAVISILLGSIFSTKLPHSDTSIGAVLSASILAYGILSTSFINLGISIAYDRDTGALRRFRDADHRVVLFHRQDLAGCHRQPRRGRSTAGGGVFVFKLRLPSSVFGWFTFSWVFVLGVVSCSLLGIFVSNFASNAVSAAAIIMLRPSACNFCPALTFPSPRYRRGC